MTTRTIQVMNNAQRFKVHRLYIGSHPRKLLIANYNIPLTVLHQDSIQTVERRIQTDFDLPQDFIYFNISATYVLKHRETQDEKFFGGSFHARGMKISELSAFRSLDSVDFIPFVLQKTNLENITQKLKVAGHNTVWELDRVLSVVVSVQGIITPNHHGLPAASNLG